MKKLTVLCVLTLLLSLFSLTAFAAIPPQPLPVLSDISASLKTIRFIEDYAYSDTQTFDVYFYTQPEDFDAFLARYAKLAQDNRYTMTETTIDGYAAYAFDSYYTAYLLPDFDGQMLFLIDPKIEYDDRPRNVLCSRCSGRGMILRGDQRTHCYYCNGTGIVTQ